MRQRNDTPHAVHVSAWPTDEEPDRAPRGVAPGEEIDFPHLLAGFTSLEPVPADEASAPKPRTRTRAADADGAEGGEPR